MGKRGFKTVKQHDQPTSPGTALANGQHGSERQQYTPSWQLLGPSYRLLRQNLEAVLVIALLPALLMQLGLLLAQNATTATPRLAIGVIVMFVALVWLVCSASTGYYLQLRAISDGRPSAWECYRQGLRYFPRIVGLGIMTGVLTMLGILLCVVPGLIVFRRYFLATYFLIDEDLGIREAMQRSKEASKPASGYIWGTLAVIAVMTGITAGISRLIPTYGNSVASLLAITYLFIPVLRYKEVGRGESALEDGTVS